MLCSLNCSCYYLCLVVVKFPLIAGYRDFECKGQYDIQVCQVSANTTVS